ncbi:uncharacterized protein LOC131927606, partial [Physella acuta]|uniref:uncharacterized protein LOC131927606 n=1 Tax=Physella acuta TaxID=109671 RepID=UPI0027DDBD23
MKKFLICLTLCNAFSAVSNAANVDGQSYANYLQIFAGSFDGGMFIYPNGTRNLQRRPLIRTPITNTRVGGSSEQKFSDKITNEDGTVVRFLVTTKILNGKILEKMYKPIK